MASSSVPSGFSVRRFLWRDKTSDGKNMSCTHVPDCPLFPKLNASLRGWRDAYCDSDSAWRDCARFRQSQTGRSVPLALLPNGRLAHTITRSRPTEPSPSRFRTSPLGAIPEGATPFERESAEPVVPEPEPVLARPAGGPQVAAPRRSTAPSAVRTAHRPGPWARLVAWLRGSV